MEVEVAQVTLVSRMGAKEMEEDGASCQEEADTAVLTDLEALDFPALAAQGDPVDLAALEEVAAAVPHHQAAEVLDPMSASLRLPNGTSPSKRSSARSKPRTSHSFAGREAPNHPYSSTGCAVWEWRSGAFTNSSGSTGPEPRRSRKMRTMRIYPMALCNATRLGH